MPYIIALVIIIVAAGALLLFRQPAEAPATPVVEEAAVEEVMRIPEGFTPPTEDPPMIEEMTDSETTASLPAEPAPSIQPVTPPAVPPVEPTAPAPVATIERQTFVAEASYFTPRRTQHDMVITFELSGETVTAVNIDYDGAPAATPAHMGFDNAYKAEVIGKNISNIQLSRVGGASLTSVAFNEAVAEIRAQL